MFSGVKDLEVACDMVYEFFIPLDLFASIMLQGKDPIPPSSIKGGSMEKLSFSVSITEPVNPRWCFPEILFTFESEIVFLEKFSL